jgi:ankyrin repeat protein
MLCRLSLLMLLFLRLYSQAAARPPENQPKYTPDQQLVIASFQLDLDHVKSLLKAGANPNTRLGFYDGELFMDKWSLGYSPYGSDKWTPLLAVAHSHREPQPEKETANTSEARDLAEESRKKIAPKLIQERDKRRVEIAKLLMGNQAKLDLDDGYGATALSSSIYLGFDSLSLALINAGANPNTITGVYIDGTDKIAPIHRATKSPIVLKALIKHGAKVDVQDENGETPLHWAVWEPNAESVKLLIESGANVNARDKKGFTAMRAIKPSSLCEFLNESEKKEEVEKKKIMQLLLAAGAKKPRAKKPNEDDLEEDDSQLSEVEQLRLKFLRSKPGEEKGTAALILFLGRCLDDINKLCYDEDDSIALCAAWQRMEKQLDARLLGVDRGADEIPVPQKLTREFLGFVEGRLKVPVPHAWSRNLLRASYHAEIKTLFEVKYLPFSGDQKEGLKSFPYVGMDSQFIGFSGTAILGEEEKAYEGEDANAQFPPELKDKIEKALKEEDPVRVTGIASRGRAVFVLHQDGLVSPGPVLMCIATNDNQEHPKLYWQTKLDSSWSSSKLSNWFTEFRVRKNKVYLFHCNDSSIGIECLSLKDGSRMFSFNSRLPE